MAFSQEIEDIDTLLQSLSLNHLIHSFQEADIDLELLLDLSDEERKDLLTEIGVSPGNRVRIMKQLKKLEAGGQPICSERSDQADDVCFFDENYRQGRSMPPETTLIDPVDLKGSSYTFKPKTIRPDSNNEDEETDSSYSSQLWSNASEDLLRFRRTDITRKEIRVALIGKTGSGKSATGNTILNNRSFFKSLFSYISITKKCSQGFVYRFGKKIVVVDTPGIFDTDLSNEKTQSEIMKCIGITSPGPHAFILVLSLSSRFTDEEQKTVDHFVKWFGTTVYQYFIVLFTRKDELDRNKMTLEEHLSQVPVALKAFIDKCGGRVLAFNNELTGIESDAQVKELVDMIQENVVRNGGKCYTNEAYIKAEIEVKKMEERILRKAREEAEEKLKKLRESKTKKEVEAEEEVVRNNLREREENIRDVTRKEIEEKGFLRRSMDYIRSWLRF